MGEIVEFVTEYLVTSLPREMVDDSDGYSFTLTVEWRGGDRWRVQRGAFSLTAAGVWEHGSKDDDEHIARTRFDLDTALRMAREAAPKVTVNGYTVDDCIRMYRDRKDDRD